MRMKSIQNQYEFTMIKMMCWIKALQLLMVVKHSYILGLNPFFFFLVRMLNRVIIINLFLLVLNLIFKIKYLSKSH